jgi:hypothetical protein
MKLNAYLLVFLTFWAQFDDLLLTPVFAVQSAPLPTDDDEYLPTELREQREHINNLRGRVSVGMKPQIEHIPIAQRDVPSQSNIRTPSGPCLYVLMSLQI